MMTRHEASEAPPARLTPSPLTGNISAASPREKAVPFVSPWGRRSARLAIGSAAIFHCIAGQVPTMQ